MIGMGTVVNTIAIAAGGLAGLVSRRFLKERYQETITKTTGFAVAVMGLCSVMSSLTVCVGAMAIIGAIQDGISGNPNTLYAKAILDLIIIAMMTASLGKGCIFSAIPVAVFQGMITILAKMIAPVMTEAAVSNISLVGNVLICCVGINLIWPKTIRVANILPSVVIAVIFAHF